MREMKSEENEMLGVRVDGPKVFGGKKGVFIIYMVKGVSDVVMRWN